MQSTLPFLALFLLTGPVHAYQIISFPYHLDFNDPLEDYSDRAELGDYPFWTSTIVDNLEWRNSRAYKVDLKPGQGDWEVGIGMFRHDFPVVLGGMRPGSIYIRILIKYSADYHLAQDPEEVKDIILRRCNSNCSDEADSSLRGIVLHWHNGGNDYPTIGENIGSRSQTQPGFHDFATPDYAGAWICFEYELDLLEGAYRIYLDTEDGKYRSNGGTTPYSVLMPLSGAGEKAWHHVNRIFGYMEGYQAHTTGSGYEVHYLLDEVKIDTVYIGPPEGFHTAAPPSGPANLRIISDG